MSFACCRRHLDSIPLQPGVRDTKHLSRGTSLWLSRVQAAMSRGFLKMVSQSDFREPHQESYHSCGWGLTAFYESFPTTNRRLNRMFHALRPWGLAGVLVLPLAWFHPSSYGLRPEFFHAWTPHCRQDGHSLTLMDRLS